MHTRTMGLAMLVAAGLLGPHAAQAQDYAPPDPQFPLPLYSNRPEAGGPYVSGEFIFWRQTNPLKDQVVAVRGLLDFDGSITSQLNTIFVPTTAGTVVPIPGPNVPGNFLGSGTPALTTGQVHGPQTYQPGFEASAGWRFRNGFVLDFSWIHLVEAKYAAVATLALPGLHPDNLLADTFLFAPVFNFPNDFAGPPLKVALGNPGAAYGVWNGATVMEEIFIQRFDQYEATGRIPLYQDECNRCYGLVGPRITWFWERFRWRTVAAQFDGATQQDWVGLYDNRISQRLYGVHFGGGDEYRLGTGPAGTFSLSVDLQAAIFLDIANERADYMRGDFETASIRKRLEYKPVPELQANFNLWWYPIEGIQLRVGYDAMAFFNTISSPTPVDFNYGAVNPPWRDGTFRFLDGLNAGMALIF